MEREFHATRWFRIWIYLESLSYDSHRTISQFIRLMQMRRDLVDRVILSVLFWLFPHGTVTIVPKREPIPPALVDCSTWFSIVMRGLLRGISQLSWYWPIGCLSVEAACLLVDYFVRYVCTRYETVSFLYITYSLDLLITDILLCKTFNNRYST